MVEILLALIAAGGSVLTAYVAVLARRTEKTVNGRTDELLARVALLEELLRFSRAGEVEARDELATRRVAQTLDSPLDTPEP